MRCKGKTQSGDRCSRQSETKYCWQHVKTTKQVGGVTKEQIIAWPDKIEEECLDNYFTRNKMYVSRTLSKEAEQRMIREIREIMKRCKKKYKPELMERLKNMINIRKRPTVSSF